MKNVETSKLSQILSAEIQDQGQQTLYRNMFAMGCYLHLVGEHRTGIKLCRSVLECLGYNRRKTYFLDLIDHMAGREEDFAEAIEPNSEVLDLFINRRLAEQNG